MREQITQALQALKTHFDKDNSEPSIFSNHRQFKAALADIKIESDAKKIRNLLNIAIGDMKAYSRLGSGLSGNNPFVVDNLVSEMVSDYLIDKAAAQTAIECIAELLGYVPKFPSQPAPQSQPQIVITQQNPQNQPTPAGAAIPPPLAQYHVGVNGQATGPFNLNTLMQMVQSGQLTSQSQVWKPGMPDWVIAGTVPELGGLFAQQPPPLSPQTPTQPKKNSLPNSGIKITPKKNSIIPFGNYEWRVLDVQNDRALILSENIIEQRKYNEEFKGVTWEICTLRKYLNSEFIQKFTGEQQKRIVETRVTNNDNLWYGTKGGNDTMDRIFLLSLEEADKYFGDSGDYQNKRSKKLDNGKFVADNDGYGFCNTHDGNRMAKLGDKACWWWLRSPGGYGSDAVRVGSGGFVYVRGGSVIGSGGGVRPALWLNL